MEKKLKKKIKQGKYKQKMNKLQRNMIQNEYIKKTLLRGEITLSKTKLIGNL